MKIYSVPPVVFEMYEKKLKPHRRFVDEGLMNAGYINIKVVPRNIKLEELFTYPVLIVDK